MSQWLETAGLVAGSSVLGSALTKLIDRRKDKADAAQLVVSAAVALVAPLTAKVEELTLRVDTLDTKNKANETKLGLAISYIRSLRSWISDQIPDKTPPAPPVGLGL